MYSPVILTLFVPTDITGWRCTIKHPHQLTGTLHERFSSHLNNHPSSLKPIYLPKIRNISPFYHHRLLVTKPRIGDVRCFSMTSSSYTILMTVWIIQMPSLRRVMEIVEFYWDHELTQVRQLRFTNSIKCTLVYNLLLFWKRTNHLFVGFLVCCLKIPK